MTTSFRNSEKVSEEREFRDQRIKELGEKEVHKPGKCISTPSVSVILSLTCTWTTPVVSMWSVWRPRCHSTEERALVAELRPPPVLYMTRSQVKQPPNKVRKLPSPTTVTCEMPRVALSLLREEERGRAEMPWRRALR